MTPSASSRGRTGEVAPPEQPSFEVLQEFAGALVEQLLPGLLDGVARSTAEILETVRLEGDAARAAAHADAVEQSRAMMKSFRERRQDVLVTPPVAEVIGEFTADERLAQRELALAYDAWRTLLGRQGAAVVFLADRVGDKAERDRRGKSVLIRYAPFASTNADWNLVATIVGVADPVQVRLRDEALPVVVAIPPLKAEQDLARLEIHDLHGRPRYVGLGPALQTHRQERQGEPQRSLDPIKER